MHRCLVVGNQTLGGTRLVEAVQQRLGADGAEFFVVVPATPIRDQEVGPGPDAGPSLQERAYALARQRLEAALDQLRALGAITDGEVGDADPLEAARLAHRRFGADEVIVCTLPLGVSRWLRGNLPRKVERLLGVPVVHLLEEPGQVA